MRRVELRFTENFEQALLQREETLAPEKRLSRRHCGNHWYILPDTQADIETFLVRWIGMTSSKEFKIMDLPSGKLLRWSQKTPEGIIVDTLPNP